jgi:hypothetical protein
MPSAQRAFLRKLMRQVNSFTGPVPSAPTDLNSRGVTRGAYRGFGDVYDVAIPAGTIVAGTNTVRCHHFIAQLPS